MREVSSKGLPKRNSRRTVLTVSRPIMSYPIPSLLGRLKSAKPTAKTPTCSYSRLAMSLSTCLRPPCSHSSQSTEPCHVSFPLNSSRSPGRPSDQVEIDISSFPSRPKVSMRDESSHSPLAPSLPGGKTISYRVKPSNLNPILRDATWLFMFKELQVHLHFRRPSPPNCVESSAYFKITPVA